MSAARSSAVVDRACAPVGDIDDSSRGVVLEVPTTGGRIVIEGPAGSRLALAAMPPQQLVIEGSTLLNADVLGGRYRLELHGASTVEQVRIRFTPARSR